MAERGELSAEEAAAALGISRATLYAYVSRGLIRSFPGSEGSRERRYSAADVALLQARQEQRRAPERVAATALAWGAPVLESGLTLITPDGLYYRGRDVVALAQECSIEQVAALLWQGTLPAAGAASFAAHPGLPRFMALMGDLPAHLAPLQQFQAALPIATTLDPAAYDVREAAVIRTGGRIMRLLTHLIGGEGDLPIAQQLQHAIAPDLPGAARLFDMALILCADHELNVSTFTARCVASAAATPYAVVAAGLAALEGVRHGGMAARAGALLREVEHPTHAYALLAERLQRGEPIPGFGHRLYPEGDPRAQALLAALARDCPDAPVVAVAAALAAAALELIGERPTIDLALAALTAALRLPPGMEVALFALGRTVGWIGHAIEEYAREQLIRPRATYTGPLPAQSG
jgi:citrate synthase